MTARARYLAGLSAVAVVGAAVGAAQALPVRAAVWTALAAALVAQGPLGWLVIRAVGGEGLLRIWGAGMVGRVALLGAAWLAAPALGLARGPLLVALVTVLLLLLGIEVIVIAYQVGPRGGGQ